MASVDELLNETVQRYDIADYLKCGGAFEFMGTGFNTLDENPSAQTDQKTYISDKSSTTITKGYQTQFPFDTDLIKNQKPVMELYTIGRDHATGSAAQREYVRVDLFQPVTGKDNTFKARKFIVSAEVSGMAGNGGETVKVTGNLNAVGDPVFGEFNTTTKTFTADEDEEVSP